MLDDDFDETLWNPVRHYAQQYRVGISLGAPVSWFSKAGNSFVINGERFDYAIIAADVKGTKGIIGHSDYFKHEHPAFFNRLTSLKQSQRYSVLRVWIDKDIRPDVPFFVFTDALQILDSVTVYHRIEKTSRAWVQKNGGEFLNFIHMRCRMISLKRMFATSFSRNVRRISLK